MRITDYAFGTITIDGRTWTSDVIVYPDRVDGSWWRREGHYLQKEDLRDVADNRPETVIIGTGAMGIMTVPYETIRFLESLGCEVVVAKSGRAVEEFNRRTGRTIGLFHLTC